MARAASPVRVDDERRSTGPLARHRTHPDEVWQPMKRLRRVPALGGPAHAELRYLSAIADPATHHTRRE